MSTRKWLYDEKRGKQGIRETMISRHRPGSPSGSSRRSLNARVGGEPPNRATRLTSYFIDDDSNLWMIQNILHSFTGYPHYVRLCPTMNVRAHAYVSGRVQGVFFRDFTRRSASALGLKGWVRNLYDGRVEVVAEGEKDTVKSLISILREGPPMSRVENVDVSWEEYTGEFNDFRVTYTVF